MPGFFTNIILWATFALLLGAVGWDPTGWQFWCFIGLFWCAVQVGRALGKADGILDFIELSESEQQRIKRALKQIKEKSNG